MMFSQDSFIDKPGRELEHKLYLLLKHTIADMREQLEPLFAKQVVFTNVTVYKHGYMCTVRPDGSNDETTFAFTTLSNGNVTCLADPAKSRMSAHIVGTKFGMLLASIDLF